MRFSPKHNSHWPCEVSAGLGPGQDRGPRPGRAGGVGQAGGVGEAGSFTVSTVHGGRAAEETGAGVEAPRRWAGHPLERGGLCSRREFLRGGLTLSLESCPALLGSGLLSVFSEDNSSLLTPPLQALHPY